MGEETITISKELYDQLMWSDKLLNHLEAMGVDNWEGYSWPDDDEEEEDDE